MYFLGYLFRNVCVDNFNGFDGPQKDVQLNVCMSSQIYFDIYIFPRLLIFLHICLLIYFNIFCDLIYSSCQLLVSSFVYFVTFLTILFCHFYSLRASSVPSPRSNFPVIVTSDLLFVSVPCLLISYFCLF